MPELKWRSCPFCGGEFFSEIDMTYFGCDQTVIGTGKNVRCDTCGAEAPSTIWNTRADEHA